MNIIKTSLVLLLVTFLFGCSAGLKIERINFVNNYKFNRQIQNQIKTDTVAWKHQIAASDYAMKGSYRKALVQWDLAFNGNSKEYNKKQVDSINSKYIKKSAADYIIEQSKKEQIIIINEAHHNSSHRVFTKSLLKKLFDNGFKNLGLEALSNGKDMDSLLNQRKYPIQNSGHYIKDPQFGNMVRTALEIGYNVFPYEQTTGVNGEKREIEQAKNIQKVMQEKQNQKFLIHCGFDHSLEGKYRSWGKTMSGRLHEYTGINPLTINQTIYSERSNIEYNNRFLKAINITKPTILLDSNKIPLGYKRGESWSDIVVMHPNTKGLMNRPNWLFDNGNIAAPIDLSNVNISFPVMLLAYKKGEDINTAVPIDIIEATSITDKLYFALKKGKYEIVVVNELSEAIKFNLIVE